MIISTLYFVENLLLRLSSSTHNAPVLVFLPIFRRASVAWLGVELVADVVNHFCHILVEVVKLVHKEGVLSVGVGGDVLQLVLRRPGDADGVRDHTWRVRDRVPHFSFSHTVKTCSKIDTFMIPEFLLQP